MLFDAVMNESAIVNFFPPFLLGLRLNGTNAFLITIAQPVGHVHVKCKVFSTYG